MAGRMSRLRSCGMVLAAGLAAALAGCERADGLHGGDAFAGGPGVSTLAPIMGAGRPGGHGAFAMPAGEQVVASQGRTPHGAAPPQAKDQQVVARREAPRALPLPLSETSARLPRRHAVVPAI